MSERDVFIAAVQLDDPEQRRAYLDAACAGRPELRDRVEELLRLHAGAGSFLDRPAVPPLATGPFQEPAAPTSPGEAAGAVLGPYQLLEPLGEGGMGSVWLAQQAAPVKRLVAVKLIKAGMDSKQVLARFEAERQALALMDHPNIARVLDGGQTPPAHAGGSPRPYFVMDLVQGVPITRYCDEHRLTPRERLELFLPVCQAVQHAHQKGVIHRDLKPSNVLVALYDGRPVPKVIDFGIAKATGEALTEKPLVTGLGNIVGTLEYMSPEQAEINQRDIDTRSDIYSLGVLMYELLTGSPPFTRRELEKAGVLEMLRVIREQEPSRPSTRLSTAEGLPTLAANRGMEPAKLTRLVRGELDWIVLKALEKDRSRRYDTANGFALDVQRYLADEPVLACPPSAGYRLRKFARRHKVVLTMAALVVTLLTLAVGVLTAANYRINKALTAESSALAEKSRAYDEMGVAKRDAEQALALERIALYYHRIYLAHHEWGANRVGRADQLLNDCPGELRHWEWHYLKRLCNAQRFTLRVVDTQDVEFRCVAYSPDGRLIAVGHKAGIQLWDAADGKPLRALSVGVQVRHLAFSPDGRRLALTDENAWIRVYDLGPGGVVVGERLLTTPLRLGALVYSPDGNRFATHWGDVVLVLDAQSGREVWRVTLDGGHFVQLAYGQDGRHLAISTRFTFRVWEADTGKEKPGDWRQVNNGSGAVAFGLQGKLLATGGRPSVVLWNVETGKRVGELPLRGAAGLVLEATFSPDSQHLAVAEDNVTVVWNVPRRTPVATLRGHTEVVSRLAYSPDGRRLASLGRDNVVKVWDALSPLEYRTLEKMAGEGPVASSARADRLATVYASSFLQVWDAGTAREVARLLTGGRSPTRKPVALSADGRQVVSTGKDDATLRLWDVDTRRELRALGPHKDPRCVAFSLDGRRLASGANDGSIKLWDLASGQEPRILTGHRGGVMQVAFSPDDRLLASAGLDGDVRLWDVAAGREVHTLRGHTDFVKAVAFSRDGRRLVSGSFDRTVKVWDVPTGQEVGSFGRHGTSVAGVALSPDGLRLAVGLRDGSVLLWDTVNKREAITLQTGAEVGSVAFSPDGTRLLTGSCSGVAFAGVAKIWDGTPWPSP